MGPLGEGVGEVGGGGGGGGVMLEIVKWFDSYFSMKVATCRLNMTRSCLSFSVT